MDLWWFESSKEGIIFQPSFIIIIITTNRYISPLFKAMCPTKWSRLYRPFLTSATLSGMMYTAPKASVCYEMHLIVFTSTVRSTKWVVFAQMDLTCLDLMRQSTIYTHLRIWCTQWTWDAIKQMLTTNTHLNKLATAWVNFVSHGDVPRAQLRC